LRLSGTCSNH